MSCQSVALHTEFELFNRGEEFLSNRFFDVFRTVHPNAVEKGIALHRSGELRQRQKDGLPANLVIKAGENPANIIFREIIKHKFENDHTNLNSYQYEVYNKLEFDLTNISDKMKRNKLLKPFAFVWDNIDSTETNSKPFLPFFISETLSDIYYRSNPSSKKEVIKASKVSGLENDSVTQFLGDMYQRVNVYDNFIELFGKGFISPASDLGLVYYRYYLLDSAFLDDHFQIYV